MEPADQLTLEQQFELQKMKQEAQNLSDEQALNLLINARKLLMLKDNVIRSLMNGNNR